MLSQQMQSTANPYQLRSFTVDSKRIHRASLSPNDAAAMSGRRYEAPLISDILQEARSMATAKAILKHLG